MRFNILFGNLWLSLCIYTFQALFNVTFTSMYLIRFCILGFCIPGNEPLYTWAASTILRRKVIVRLSLQLLVCFFFCIFWSTKKTMPIHIVILIFKNCTNTKKTSWKPKKKTPIHEQKWSIFISRKWWTIYS